MNKEIISIKNLSISFQQYGGKGNKQIMLPVIKDLNVTIHEHEIVAVVGSSGSGKSLLAHAILGILPYNCETKGNIQFDGEVLDAKRIEKVRGKEIVLVPQSVNYLDPLEKVGRQIRKERKEKKYFNKEKELLKYYELDDCVDQMYPFELSGGMARRVLLSTAMMEQPKLIIADEPTPGLHLNAAKAAMKHFRDYADQGGGVLLITHDIELALEVADRIAIFYAGTTVEEAYASDFHDVEALRHPYSKVLCRALPQYGFHAIPGTQPYVKNMPEGCPFGPRCSEFTEECRQEIKVRELRGGTVRCIHAR